MAQLVSFPLSAGKGRNGNRLVTFDRRELMALMAIYSVRVAKGEWRDYAIDTDSHGALFSIFRHSHENPLWRVAKLPGAGREPPAYMLYEGGRIVRRSGSLEDILGHLRRELALVRD